MAHLSVNVNKIATLRNSRGGNIPDLLQISGMILDSGADGITIHPREDERHITKEDVFALSDFLKNYNHTKKTNKEFNIEGEPSQRFLDIVLAVKPNQVTLVPVTPGEITSDHGFALKDPSVRSSLEPIIQKIKAENMRVSLFMETDMSSYSIAKEIGADRIELYTGPFAHVYDESEELGKKIFLDFIHAAEAASKLGLGVNAGHDLDTNNLKVFSKLPHLMEVSIGHRLVSQSLVDGIEKTIKQYLKILSPNV
ncbi:pyridoxine 5'-phosphate synthase [Leptospira sp. 96542]|nr:pyridoxine 5'-phosphate synthase [Leptospira sp. 96542]